MDSARRAEVDAMLEGLGAVAPDLGQTVERYVGPGPITLQVADRLLAELDRGALAPTPPSPVRLQRARDERSGRDESEVSGAEQPSPIGTDRIDSDRGQDNDRGQNVSGRNPKGAPLNMLALPSREADQPRRDVATSEREAAGTSPNAIESSQLLRDNSSTARASTPRSGREASGTTVQRKTFLPDGLLGVDDLPNFPGTRSLPAAKAIEEPKTAMKATEPAFDDDSDSFEILVDEEILEIESEDSLDEPGST